MNYLFSRMHREEILRWMLICALVLWGGIATAWSLSRDERIILISVDDMGVRLVSGDDDQALKNEELKFLEHFVQVFMNFDSDSYPAQISAASDLMSSRLWAETQGKYLAIRERLKIEPLTQVGVLESIDQSGENQFDLKVSLRIKQKLEEKLAAVRISVSIKRRARSDTNPWRYEIVELKDESI